MGAHCNRESDEIQGEQMEINATKSVTCVHFEIESGKKIKSAIEFKSEV